ncbi:hypothetical protein K438DRAFT_1762574 [Mycena galopus ATCC 62051]|nr:hypothetical protein K438DRAFT_1762574 [Mycena galopus ATCC 62051]
MSHLFVDAIWPPTLPHHLHAVFSPMALVSHRPPQPRIHRTARQLAQPQVTCNVTGAVSLLRVAPHRNISAISNGVLYVPVFMVYFTLMLACSSPRLVFKPAIFLYKKDFWRQSAGTRTGEVTTRTSCRSGTRARAAAGVVVATSRARLREAPAVAVDGQVALHVVQQTYTEGDMVKAKISREHLQNDIPPAGRGRALRHGARAHGHANAETSAQHSPISCPSKPSGSTTTSESHSGNQSHFLMDKSATQPPSV